MIEWRESYSTGFFNLDEQHKHLFEYCNDLEKGLNRGSASGQMMERALMFLGNYVKYHFGQEETCMHKHECPISNKNKLAHEKFIQAFKTFQRTISEDGDNEGILRGLHHFLESWLVEHICKIDVQIKQCVLKSR